MLDVESIEVVEEFGHPFVHDLMIGPSELQFVEEDSSALGCFGAEGGEDGGGEVIFNGLAVALVEFAGMVVGGALGAHVVAACVDLDVIRISKHSPGSFLILESIV